MQLRTDHLFFLHLFIRQEAVEPFLVSGRFQQFGHCSQGIFTVAQYGNIRFHILVYLCRINIEMDYFCLRRIRGQLARHTIVKTHAYRNQHIALIGIDIRPQIAMHAQHPLVQRMLCWQCGKPQQGATGRHIRLFDESTQFVLRIAKLHALPHQHQRTFRRIYQISSLLYGFRFHFGYRQIAAHVIHFGRHIFRLIHLSVLGKVQHNRTGTSALRYIESAGHCPCHIFRTTDLIAPLRDGLRNAHQIHLLKGIGSKESRSNLSGNDNNRRAVYHGIRNTCNGVRCARTAGNQAYAHLTRHTRIALCRMCSSLFMAHQNMIQILSMVV